jgi:hypothetical protein
MFRPPQNKVTPRHVDRRKRFLEAALASAASPSPSPPPVAPLPGARVIILSFYITDFGAEFDNVLISLSRVNVLMVLLLSFAHKY